MGAWGITAFESDTGLDVIDAIRNRLPKDGRLTLKSLIEFVQNSNEWSEFDDPQLGNSHTSPLTVAELIFKIQDNDYTAVDYEEEWAKEYPKFQELSSFTADKESLLWLKDYLKENLAAARNNAVNSTDPVDPYNGWFYKENWEEWQRHMETMIERMGELHERPEDEVELLSVEQTQEDAQILSM